MSTDSRLRQFMYKRVRPFNKFVTNRLLRVFARAARGPFAVLRHVGRNSGKSYETTIMVWPLRDVFVIALTYGSKVDWLRNLQAASQATLLWHGKEYMISQPESLDSQAALLAFPHFIRSVLSRQGTHEFIKVKGYRS